MTVEKAEIDTSGFPKEIETLIKQYIPNSQDMPLKLMRRVNRDYGFFQRELDDAMEALPLLTCVVHADIDTLIPMVETFPELLFKKGQISFDWNPVTQTYRQTFYNVSAYQLMTFLCDADMKAKIMPLIPPTIPQKTGSKTVEIDLQALRKKQYAEIDRGGADLVKLDRDPTAVGFEFVNVTRFITSYTIYNQQHPVTFSLLENPDGIISYQNAATRVMNLYYANQRTKTVTLIPLSQEQRQALDGLLASFAKMEPNSSRRSSNAEHELIALIMNRTLFRKGIEYELDGVLYRDCRMQFNYMNNARACIRLDSERLYGAADALWRSGVGGAQRQVLWLLQRFCEKNHPFYPLPDFDASPFQRSFIIYNCRTDKEESVFSGGVLVAGLGGNFGIVKGGADGLGVAGGGRSFTGGWGIDLVAVNNRLVENARASVVEITAEKDLSPDDSKSNHLGGPG